jgi:hypothetical protein
MNRMLFFGLLGLISLLAGPSVPIWLLLAALIGTAQVYFRERQAPYWFSAGIIGVISTLVSLSYRRCGTGPAFDSSMPIPTVYRGWPFAWIGWTGPDSLLAPSSYLGVDLLYWIAIASLGLAAGRVLQSLIASTPSDKRIILVVGISVIACPLLIALALGGQQC